VRRQRARSRVKGFAISLYIGIILFYREFRLTPDLGECIMATSMAELREIVSRTAVTVDNLGITTDQAIKELAESQKMTELAQRKTELALQKTQITLEKTIEELSGNISGVNRRLGEIV
jgi:hypothetical protein